MFRIWCALAHGPETPDGEHDLFDDDELVSRIWPTIVSIKFPDGMYRIGGVWQLQQHRPTLPSPEEYIQEKEATFRRLLDTSPLSAYESGIVFQTFRTSQGVLIGMCHLVYGQESPRAGGEPLPIAA